MAATMIVAAPAFGQAYQCRMPARPALTQPERGPRVSVPTAYYVLALSWSPEYCRGRQASPGDSLQCSGRNGRFGLVLHGLWPNGSGTRDPQYCSPRPSVSPSVVVAQLCRMPSARIIEHEWQKHGTCVARSPAEYWGRAAQLYDRLQFPDLIRLSRRKPLSAGDVRREFEGANPAYPVQSIGLLLSGRGWLKEIHLCLDRSFKPMSCPGKARGPGDGARVSIWRGL